MPDLAIKPFEAEGMLARVSGHELEVRGLRLRLGDQLLIHSQHGPAPAEVVALNSESATALVYGDTFGLGRGDRVTRVDGPAGVTVGHDVIGRVLDAFGSPLDGGPPITGDVVRLDQAPPQPLERRRIDHVISTGVKVVDTLCTTGLGQRIGIFGGSGVGKSTLLGMMAKGTSAPVTVVALVGERGREVREFIDDELGPEGMARTVLVVATSDQPALMRLRAAVLATRVAEWFADRGTDTLLMVDSLTRLAMAQREIGLAAGEPPTARGYTPSVFSLLPKLLERSGPRSQATVTGIYTVLVDGDDMNDPIADAARSILDGHVVLDRRLANAGRFPAIDPLASLSRLAAKLWNSEQERIASGSRAALAAAAEVKELVEVGAYVAGTNPAADIGLATEPHLIEFFRQRPNERVTFDESWQMLGRIATELGIAP